MNESNTNIRVAIDLWGYYITMNLTYNLPKHFPRKLSIIKIGKIIILYSKQAL